MTDNATAYALSLLAAWAAIQAPTAPPAVPTPRPSPLASAAPATALEGVVKGPDGKPVEKAKIVTRPEALQNREEPTPTQTDAEGRFRIAVRSAGPYALRVIAKGLAPQIVPKVRPGAPVTVSLQTGGVIEGRVLNTAGGVPVAGARVEAEEDRPRFAFGWAGQVTVEATTDAQGRFRLEGLAPGLYSIAARARGLTGRRHRSVAVGSKRDLLLFAGAWVTGTVRDGANRPIPGAEVRADARLTSEDFALTTPSDTTDAQGRFEIAGLAPGAYAVTARAKGFAPGWVSHVVLERGVEGHADLVLEPGYTIIGRLVDPSKEPTPGRVRLDWGAEGVPRTVNRDFHDDPGDDGRFRLPALPAGDYVLVAESLRYLERRLEATAGGPKATVDLGDIVLDAGLTIRGHVRDKAGRGVSEASIAAYDRSGYAGLAQTDASGSYALGRLPPGTYDLAAHGHGFGRTSRSADAGDDDVDFVLEPSGSISGVVVDEGGRPMDSFEIKALPAERTLDSDRPGTVEAGGRFSIEDLEAGRYTLVATAPDRIQTAPPQVTVTAGRKTEARVVLRAGAVVRGSVVDTAGAAVAGAAVSVSRAGMAAFLSPSGPGIVTALTDLQGAFEVRGVPRGTVRIEARHPDYVRGVLETVELPAGRDVHEMRLVLRQGGRVEGHARHRDGSGFVGAWVSARFRLEDVPPWTLVSDLVTVPVRADGSFHLEHVPAGHLEVSVSTGGVHSRQARQVDVVEGETTAVEFASREITVRGHVTRRGAPAAGLRVTLAGTQETSAVTGEEGEYSLVVDDPGDFRAAVESVDGRAYLLERRVTIPDTPSHVLDLALAGATVSGTVVEKDSERPIAGAVVSLATPAGPIFGLRTTTTADGRFTLEAEPGDYLVSAHAEKYSTASDTFRLDPAGQSDLKLVLSRGRRLTGRVLDAAGRPVEGTQVWAIAANPLDILVNMPTVAMTLADGSFELNVDPQAPYTLTATAPAGASAFQTGVTAGGGPVTLTLRPGGVVQVTVRGPDGTPAAGVALAVAGVGGAPLPSGSETATDAHGRAQLRAPAGPVEIQASRDPLSGSTTVEVPSGGTVAAEIRLRKTPEQ